jgi:hypothetical protein
MEYLILIADKGDTYGNLSTAERAEVNKGHTALIENMGAAGVKWDGRQLQPAATATTVRGGEGAERLITDGPYAETKEQLGGYYLIDVPDLDAALVWAKQIPLLAGSAIEVRPVVAR